MSISLLTYSVWSYVAATGAGLCETTKTKVTCETGLPVVGAGGAQLQQILQIVFGVLAALAVLFIIIGGLRYITSQGNPQETAKARDTIIYALIGLVVAVLAQVIVLYVLDKV